MFRDYNSFLLVKYNQGKEVKTAQLLNELVIVSPCGSCETVSVHA
jgi:hypothetical protein